MKTSPGIPTFPRFSARTRPDNNSLIMPFLGRDIREITRRPANRHAGAATESPAFGGQA
jgi:hypothetical protein